MSYSRSQPGGDFCPWGRLALSRCFSGGWKGGYLLQWVEARTSYNTQASLATALCDLRCKQCWSEKPWHIAGPGSTVALAYSSVSLTPFSEGSHLGGLSLCSSLCPQGVPAREARTPRVKGRQSPRGAGLPSCRKAVFLSASCLGLPVPQCPHL